MRTPPVGGGEPLGQHNVEQARELAPRIASEAYARAVLDVTELIPEGRVLTYGDIAELLTCGGPRQVGRALSRASRDVPWWRVLRAGGHPARGLALHARPHYDDECTPLSVRPGTTDPEDFRVDLASARWWPSDADHAVLAALGASLRRAGP